MAVSGRRRWLLITVGVAALAAVLAPLLPILRPPTATPRAADAVIVLGGAGERLETAWDLMDDGVAPTLAISRGEYLGWPKEEPDPLCNRRTSYETLCFVPDPETTRGEARAIGRLASERRWDSVAVVTSDYHAARAATLVGQCTEADIQVVATPAQSGVRTIAKEWAGLIAAVTIQRAC